MVAQTASSLIHAGSSRETPGRTSTSMTSVPLRPLRRTTGNCRPCNGCHGYAMTTVPNRYVECRLLPRVGEHEQMTRKRIELELPLHHRLERVETAAQIHRRGGNEHPHRGREVQHGRAVSRVSTNGRAAALKRMVSPSGRCTSASHGDGSNIGLSFTSCSGRDVPAATWVSSARQRPKVDNPKR